MAKARARARAAGDVWAWLRLELGLARATRSIWSLVGGIREPGWALFYYNGDKSPMNPTLTQETSPPPSCIGQRPWERPKARAKARARARARASNGLMCVKEGRPNVMLKENSETKIAAPGGTRTHNLLHSWQGLLLQRLLGKSIIA